MLKTEQWSFQSSNGYNFSAFILPTQSLLLKEHAGPLPAKVLFWGVQLMCLSSCLCLCLKSEKWQCQGQSEKKKKYRWLSGFRKGLVDTGWRGPFLCILAQTGVFFGFVGAPFFTIGWQCLVRKKGSLVTIVSSLRSGCDLVWFPDPSRRDGRYDTIIDTTDTDTDTYSIDTWFLASSIRYLIKLTWRIVFQGPWSCRS